MKMKKYMQLAYNEALKAYKNGDVPIGAIIIKNNKIIAKSYNKKEKNNNAILHAEIDAINKACKKLQTWHLEECILYTTLEPCLMCMGAIVQSRISEIYYATKNNNYGEINLIKKYNKKIKVNSGLLEKESSELLKKFFQEKRK
jgi:tRNA(adenine34) deaminase